MVVEEDEILVSSSSAGLLYKKHAYQQYCNLIYTIKTEVILKIYLHFDKN